MHLSSAMMRSSTACEEWRVRMGKVAFHEFGILFHT